MVLKLDTLFGSTMLTYPVISQPAFYSGGTVTATEIGATTPMLQEGESILTATQINAHIEAMQKELAARKEKALEEAIIAASPSLATDNALTTGKLKSAMDALVSNGYRFEFDPIEIEMKHEDNRTDAYRYAVTSALRIHKPSGVVVAPIIDLRPSAQERNADKEGFGDF
jgi:hypothetical protein